MRILLTHSYFLRFDKKQWKQQQPYPPLGTLYAASVLRNAGFDVKVYDVMFSNSPKEIESVLKDFNPDVLVIYDDGFNYLTKMCLTNMREAAFEMTKIAKRHHCKVIINSSDSTDQSEKYLNEGADVIIHGEGEFALMDVIKSLSTDANFSEIKGIVFKNNDKLVSTPNRSVSNDLDDIPFPAYDLIDIAPYKNAWKKSSGYFSINMSTTRGCPFKCNWCAKPIYGNRYNSRSPQNVVDEMIKLKLELQFDHIWFCDDIFGLKPGWVNEFADLIESEKLKISFKIQSRVDLLLQENNIRDLARAGCKQVWVGAESGSQKILDAMDKGTKVEQIYEATRLLKKNKIDACFFLQFGYPGETIDDILLTINMIKELQPNDIGVSVSYPLPGTKFYENVKTQLSEKSNWTDSDELALMFKNTYPPQFYKDLHRYIHRMFRRKQGQESLKKIMMLDFSNSSDFKKALSAPYHGFRELINKSKITKITKV